MIKYLQLEAIADIMICVSLDLRIFFYYEQYCVFIRWGAARHIFSHILEGE